MFMNTPYISPKLNIVCFSPVERLSASELDLDLNLVKISTFGLSRSAGDAASPEEDDVFLPIG